MKIFLPFALVFAFQGVCSAATAGIILVPQGKVEARTGADAQWKEISGNTKLADGNEVKTGEDSKAMVLFSDGSRVFLDKNTVFAIDKTDKKKAGFSLKLGRLKAAVAGYFTSRFEVRTPSAVCAVRGTEFDIDVAPNGGTEMNVAEGLVEVNDSKGNMAVVSSEERIKVTDEGMSPPETVSLKDAHSGDAARPMAVRQETARERTRTMLEELRNRELKANEAQLGKDSIDAFGKRVRIEEYLLRPSDTEFKLLFLSYRSEARRLDWGHLDEKFQAKIPDDISKVGDIINGMYFSKTLPTNWMTYFEVYLTNTIDSIKETIAFSAPTLVNFSGYGVSVGSRYYPSKIDYTQTLSGPGVALALGAGTGGLHPDERIQFEQIQDYNSTTPGQFTWMQKVVDASGVLSDMYGITLDPTDATDIANMGTQTFYDPSIDVTTTDSYPNGAGKADFLRSTLYADNSTVSSRKLLVSNEGDILGIPGIADSTTFLKEGSYNLEMVVTSNLFQGRNIDVLLAPEILSQKNNAVINPGTSNVQ